MTGPHRDRTSHLVSSHFLTIVGRFEELRPCPKSTLHKIEDPSRVRTMRTGEASMLDRVKVQSLRDIEILFSSAPSRL